jgi:hypothetical protein
VIYGNGVKPCCHNLAITILSGKMAVGFQLTNDGEAGKICPFGCGCQFFFGVELVVHIEEFHNNSKDLPIAQHLLMTKNFINTVLTEEQKFIDRLEFDDKKMDKMNTFKLYMQSFTKLFRFVANKSVHG